MTITAKVDAEASVAFLYVEEPWDLEELRGALGLMGSSSGFDPSMGILVDFTKVSTPPKSAEIEQYMAFLGGQTDRVSVKLAGPGWNACVAPGRTTIACPFIARCSHPSCTNRRSPPVTMVTAKILDPILFR